MNRRILIALVVVPLAAPFALDLAMPEARPPADAPPGLMTAAREVCGSPPWGRVGSLAWDTEGPGIKVVCTWTTYGRTNWRTNLSCANGEWQGPIGWSDWGGIGPCVSPPVGMAP